MNPLVSIGLPTYNRPELLDKTLRELRGQTYKNIEIIVSDNCSPDPKVKDVILKHQNEDSRVRAYFQTENIGVTKNHRFVLGKAEGSYFAFSSDDDWHHSTFIEALIKPFQDDPRVNVAVCGTVRIDEKGAFYDTTHSKDLNNEGWPVRYLLDTMKNERVSFMQVMVWDIEVSRKLDYHQRGFTGNDVIINAEMLMSHKAVYVDQYLFSKGLEHNRAREQFKEDPFLHLRIWYILVKTLTFSKYVPARRKLWIPVIAAMNFVWVIRNYAAQVLFLLPVDHPIRKRVRNLVREE